MSASPVHSFTPPASAGGQLVSLDGRPLALEGTEVRAEAAAGLARVVLEQRFRNVHAEALRAIYQLALPAEAAVSGYAFRIGERRVVGEVAVREAARERFEEAMLEGRTAALLEQERSSLFRQEVGNIPAGATVVAEIVLDQRLRWLDEGEWEWRFPTVVAPRHLGAEGEVPDAARVTVEVADPQGEPLAARATLRLAISDALRVGGGPSSPSHEVLLQTATGDAAAACVVTLSDSAARLDRDLVVRWPVGAAAPGVSLLTGRPAEGRAPADSGYGLLTLVPPLPEARGEGLPRDLVVLLDTSGSMMGEPLAQAKTVVRALIEHLGPRDRLELIEFSSAVRRWGRRARSVGKRERDSALAWLDALEASGATDMVPGIIAALAALREGAQRQVVLVTDGLIGFEEKVVAEILRGLPPDTRVHTVGVGSAVNRTLTAGAARAGRGAEVVIGLGEDPAPAVARLLARTGQPLVTHLEISGSAVEDHAPTALPDLFGGAPALVALRLRPEAGTLLVRGRGVDGPWEQQLNVPALAPGSGHAAVAALYARERVEDLEAQAAAGLRVDAAIERLGLDFQIGTRRTSWVAVSEEPTVDPGEPTRRERIPQELAHGISAEGAGLRAGAMQTAAKRMPPMAAMQQRSRSVSSAPRCRSASPPPFSLATSSGTSPRPCSSPASCCERRAAWCSSSNCPRTSRGSPRRSSWSRSDADRP